MINVWSECGSQVQVPLQEGNAALHRAQWRGGKDDDQDDEETDDGDGKDRECWESNLISQLPQKPFLYFSFFPICTIWAVVHSHSLVKFL